MMQLMGNLERNQDLSLCQTIEGNGIVVTTMSKIVYSLQGRNQEVFRSSFVIALDADCSAIAVCVNDYC